MATKKKELGLPNHRAARPMKAVMDREGKRWLCDADADPEGDLRGQGCWRCDEMPVQHND